MCFSASSGFGVMTLKIMCRCSPAQNIFALFLSLFLSVRNKAGGGDALTVGDSLGCPGHICTWGLRGKIGKAR